jgi:hypothetical protein
MKRSRIARVLLSGCLIGGITAGCSYNIAMIDRDSGQIWTTRVAPPFVRTGGVATIDIDGEAYTGPWVYAAQDGVCTVGLGVSTGEAAGGTILNTPMPGAGLISLASGPGDVIRCSFNFSNTFSSGLGECLAKDGRAFDLQITRKSLRSPL